MLKNGGVILISEIHTSLVMRLLLKAMRHEGKVTGLAAHGEPVHLDLLRRFIGATDGQLVNRSGFVFKRAIRELERRLPSGWTREELAASIQRVGLLQNLIVTLAADGEHHLHVGDLSAGR